jgi:hypothetical protein
LPPPETNAETVVAIAWTTMEISGCSTECAWRGALCPMLTSLKKRLGRIVNGGKSLAAPRGLKALQAAPLQVSNPREVFQQNPMLRCVPRGTPKPETKQLVNRELIWLSWHDLSTSFQ